MPSTRIAASVEVARLVRSSCAGQVTIENTSTGSTDNAQPRQRKFVRTAVIGVRLYPRLNSKNSVYSAKITIGNRTEEIHVHDPARFPEDGASGGWSRPGEACCGASRP